jgi:hypothetical protein
MKKLLIAALVAMCGGAIAGDFLSQTVRTGSNVLTIVSMDDTFNPPKVLDSFYITTPVTNLFTNNAALRYAHQDVTNYVPIWFGTITNTVAQTNGAEYVKDFNFPVESGDKLVFSNSCTNVSFTLRFNWKSE